MYAAIESSQPASSHGNVNIKKNDVAASEFSLEQRLLSTELLSSDGLERARRTQRESGERLEIVLTRLGLISEQALCHTLAAHYDIPLLQPEALPLQPLYLQSISLPFLKRSLVLPMSESPNELVIAMAYPSDDRVVQAMQLFSGRHIRKIVATPRQIETALLDLYGSDPSNLALDDSASSGSFDETSRDDVDRILDQASDAPVVRWVNGALAKACEIQASDIHIEPMESSLRVRLRVDGMLMDWDSPPFGYRHAIVSRIKIMAKLNIAERRLPQDGRLRTAIRGHNIDIRVSVIPTVHGESLVLRILDQSRLPLDFAALGLDAGMRGQLEELLRKPYGILLVTGPTGSGKTTTLYAALQHLNTGDKKVLTVEDPVEYRLPGINQTQVKPDIGHGFTQALRSFLRQDPDILMVGEIRDQETARIAVQAALTGHLVLSTVHTNDTASALVRLIDMGIEDYLLASTVVGVLAQRLVRALCPSCKQTQPASAELAARFGLRRLQPDGPLLLAAATGCENCQYSGYRGRTALLELLPMTESIRRLLLTAPEAHDLALEAVRQGMLTLRDHGLQKALRGETSLEEVLRVA